VALGCSHRWDEYLKTLAVGQVCIVTVPGPPLKLSRVGLCAPKGKITGEYSCAVSLVEPGRNVRPDGVGTDCLPMPTVHLSRRWLPLNSSTVRKRRCTRKRYGVYARSSAISVTQPVEPSGLDGKSTRTGAVA
jgi:hypothetical protein